MKHVLRKIFSRPVFVGLFIVLQVGVILSGLYFLNGKFQYFYLGCLVVSGLIVLHIVSRDTNPAYKIAWMIPVMAFPVFGGLLYIVFGRTRLSKGELKKMQAVTQQVQSSFPSDSTAIQALEAQQPEAALMSRYIRYASGTPLYQNTLATYLPVGENYFAHLLPALERAEKFIFMEYYIIQNGALWDSVHEILKRKAAQGLDVRVMYDDFGTMFKLAPNADQLLESEGIRSCVFNRFRPVLSARFNHRDHRKIVVIDGNVGFTGGINIADRYANAGGFEGHWLDCGVMLQGQAVQALTSMFLSVWDFVRGDEDRFSDYAPDAGLGASIAEDGFVQPFTDTPLDNEPTGATVYMNILHRAKKYVYINTPYLMVDNEMLNALTTAAKSGVDVRLVTPAISDSKLVQAMSQSYYEPLIRAGVRIYEYTPGMVHAKTFVSDDLYGVVGTINLDYRSLYLHFECAVWMTGCRAVGDMKQAYLEELNCCTPVSLQTCVERARGRRLWRAILRALAPLF